MSPRAKLEITAEELRLLRRTAQAGVESFEYRGARDADQPTEWHQAKILVRLADKLAAYRRRKS